MTLESSPIFRLSPSLKQMLRQEASRRGLVVSQAANDAERARCAADVVYWLTTFCKTYDPRLPEPILPFVPFPRQIEFLLWLKEREANQEDGVAEKCRDVGFTWLCCAYMGHAWLFRKGFKGAFGSRKLELVDRLGDPDSIFEKIRIVLRHLPGWMLPAGFSWREHDNLCKLINPESGATLTGEGGDNIGRGGRATLYIIDEAAHLERAERVEAALSQTSRCKIWVSTPNGIGNLFARKRFSGAYPVFTFRWQDDPRKTETWFQQQKRTLDPVVLAQEVEIDYAASVEGICIPAAFVRAAIEMTKRLADEPVHGPAAAGLDIAEEGKSRTVLIVRRGPMVTDVLDWGAANTTQTAWRARDEAERRGVVTLCYDATGVGAGVRGAFESAERKPAFAAVAINGGARPGNRRWPDGATSAQRFLNLRAELWWMLRSRFEAAFELVEHGIEHPLEELIALPHHADLAAQLSAPRWFHTETGKIRIESKLEMARRGVASPDFADALAYAFAAGVRPVAFVAGGRREATLTPNRGLRRG
ncbi:MAG: hypothetical protein KGJ62_15145 [Armatimonadetes bacterium]|nr:hypothetical protein [Armatimonadota bacterium]MDE2206282.1 hypothetical protein [Armatimonadota bacterium]